jgi:hypothetical protein
MGYIAYTNRSKVYDTNRAGLTSWQTLGEKPPTMHTVEIVGHVAEEATASPDSPLFVGRVPIDALITGGGLIKVIDGVLGVGTLSLVAQAAPVEGGRPFSPGEVLGTPVAIVQENIRKSSGTAGVDSFNGRSGAVSLTKNDVLAVGLDALDVGAEPAFSTGPGLELV